MRIGFTCLAIVAILSLSAYFVATSLILVDPVRIHVAGLSTEGTKRFQVHVAQQKGSAQGKTAKRWKLTPYWHMEGIWIQEMFVQIPAKELPNVRELTITVGDVAHRFSGDAVRNWERPGGSTTTNKDPDVWLTAPLPVRPSALRGFYEPLLNWPGDTAFVRAVAQYALVPILLVALIAFWWGRRHAIDVDPNEAQPGSTGAFDWLAVIVLAGSLVLLELHDPYYFTQCDTLNECLPMILVGCRYVWQGDFPGYNPYLLLGSPLANLGMDALTYPPLYVSYAVARHVLGDEYATIEVFAILHLVAGFFLTRLLGRKLGMSAGPANLVALSCVLSGSSLIMGRAWFNFIPIVVWLPLLFLGLLRLQRGPVSWAWIVGMGLALGLPMHVGFSQVAIYLVGFFCLAVLFLIGTGGLPWRRALMLLPALLLGAAIALPLVYQQWLLARDVSRAVPSGEGIAMGLPAMLLPYPLVETLLPAGWGNINLFLMGHFYFFGGLLAFLFFYHVVGLCFRRTDGLGSPSYQMWTFCGVIALWFSLGDSFGLWRFVSELPVISKINRYPFRAMPFVVFFVSVTGGLVLESMYRRARKRRRTEWIVMIVALLVLFIHVCHCRTTFHVDPFQPYPKLPADLLARLHVGDQPTGRVASWGRYSNNAAFGLQLPQNLPAVYDLPTAEGVNPLLEGNKLVSRLSKNLAEHPAQAMRAYGVRWHLCQSPDQETEAGSTRTQTWKMEVVSRFERLNVPGFLDRFPVVRYPEGLDVYESDPVDPLAFVVEKPVESAAQAVPVRRQALDIELHGWGVAVDVSRVTGQAWVVVNFLHYPEMAASVDGQTIPCQADYWGRMVVQVPQGANRLTIRYEPPWGIGVMMGVAPAIVGLGVGMMLQARMRGTPSMRA